jgi:hypothetical protein
MDNFSGPPVLATARQNVRYWHKADMLNALIIVRFWGQSGQ